MYYSPLRYPGGKRRLANFMKLMYRNNNLLDGEYAEAYAGGAAVALELLFEEYVDRVHINDLDTAIHAFWWAVLNEPDEMCSRISRIPVTMEEWERQRNVLYSDEPDRLDLAVAAFYLNRTNRSGIITGGVIGGKKQSGKWKIDARFNKDDLIARIEKIGRFRSRIELYNLDGIDFIMQVDKLLPKRSLIYLDPPYYVAGKQELYANYYDEADHADVAKQIQQIRGNWVVTYDNVKDIRELYASRRMTAYGINYSAQDKYEGDEVIIFSDGLEVPDVENPSRIKKRNFRQMELELIS